MALPNLFQSMNLALRDVQINELLQTNKDSEKYGLTITANDAKEIIEVRDDLLHGYGRIELEIEVNKKLIQNFCTSPFVNQENYISTLLDLQEVFYYMKNETADQIGDDKLIEIIRDFFNNSCGGSIELLIGRELENFIRTYRSENVNNSRL